MPSLKDIASRLLSPLLYLNVAGLGAGALWLVSLSQWQVMWIGVWMVFFSPYVIPILVIPAGVFSHYMLHYRAAQLPGKERQMFICSLGYLILFMTMWCTGIFEYVTHTVHPLAIRAGLLWTSTAALTPLLWWSSRDRSNVLIITLTEITQIAMIALAAIRLLYGASSFWTSFAIFGGIAASLTALQALYEEKYMNNSKETPG